MTVSSMTLKKRKKFHAELRGGTKSNVNRRECQKNIDGDHQRSKNAVGNPSILSMSNRRRNCDQRKKDNEKIESNRQEHDRNQADRQYLDARYSFRLVRWRRFRDFRLIDFGCFHDEKKKRRLSNPYRYCTLKRSKLQGKSSNLIHCHVLSHLYQRCVRRRYR